MIDVDSDVEEPFVTDLRRHGVFPRGKMAESRQDRAAVQDIQKTDTQDEIDAVFLAEVKRYGIADSSLLDDQLLMLLSSGTSENQQ
jgi:hypothetical protein